jgi:hypothetical protein
MEYDFILLCYGLFKISKTTIILKVFLSIKIDYFLELSFWILKKIPYNLKWNWNWEKMLISITSKYSHLNAISKYTMIWTLKVTPYYRKWNTLMCFHPLLKQKVKWRNKKILTTCKSSARKT